MVIPVDCLDEISKFGNDQILISLSIKGIKDKITYAAKTSKSAELRPQREDNKRRYYSTRQRSICYIDLILVFLWNSIS